MLRTVTGTIAAEHVLHGRGDYTTTGGVCDLCDGEGFFMTIPTLGASGMCMCRFRSDPTSHRAWYEGRGADGWRRIDNLLEGPDGRLVSVLGVVGYGAVARTWESKVGKAVAYKGESGEWHVGELLKLEYAPESPEQIRFHLRDEETGESHALVRARIQDCEDVARIRHEITIREMLRERREAEELANTVNSV